MCSRRGRSFAALVIVLAVAGCSSTSGRPSISSPAATSSASTSSPASRSVSRTPTPTPSRTTRTTRTTRPTPVPRTPAERVLAGMSLRQRVGQLLMVDCPSTGLTASTRSAIVDDHVGAIILDGTSQAGMQATQNVTAGLRALAPRRVGLFVSTDQEGGIVQRLQGPGFDRIPSAVVQGGTAPAALERQTAAWAAQLRAAGVNVDLAPVLDTVPAGSGPNPPIGDLERQYGSTPDAVTAHGMAVVRGLTGAGIFPTVKHFPGLGRVSGNTDTTSGVTDYATSRDDPYLGPFRAAVQAHVPFVMMSTAIYSRLDPGTPAAFSRPIITGLLRTRLGFGGIVISDDLGAAQQVSQYSPGERAVRFVAAGGDMVLTVVAGQAGEMSDALVARAGASRTFRAKIDAAALLVLQAKQAAGLLHP